MLLSLRALLSIGLTFCLLFRVLAAAGDIEHSAPNVLLISIDDLNDWIGCLGGHPQAQTPNMDRLANRGTLFTNAHCASPLCNPSRAAVFSGRSPLETGLYTNDQGDIRKLRPDLKLLPTPFSEAGYETFGAGKLLHQSSGSLFDHGFFPHLRWSPFDPKQVEYSPDELPAKGTPQQARRIELQGQELVMPFNRMPSDRQPSSPRGESFDWAALPVEDADMGDGQIAAWGAKVLSKSHERPFFLAVGFYRPHIPLYAPQKYFSLFDPQKVELPAVLKNDLSDVGPFAQNLARTADTAGSHATVLKHGQWRDAVRSYLACIAFIDHQVGKLLSALESGPHARDTLIVLWSDHGWHLGEKEHWGKWTLWRRATRAPLIVALPAEQAGEQPRRVDEAVSLLDIYPTLAELCDLKSPQFAAGQSLAAILQGQTAPNPERMVVTTLREGDFSLTGRDWRFIEYRDGATELYDLTRDAQEWNNLASDPKYGAIVALYKRELARQLRMLSP